MAAKRTWHREDIKAALRKRYGALGKLSASWGRNPACISHVLARHGYSTDIERQIAQALDTTPHALWPERWTRGGQPIPAPKPDGQKTTPATLGMHRLIRKAA